MCQKYLFSSERIHVSVLAPPPFPFLFFVLLFSHMLFSHFRLQTERAGATTARRGQPAESATWKESKREVNLHYIPSHRSNDESFFFCIVHLLFCLFLTFLIFFFLLLSQYCFSRQTFLKTTTRRRSQQQHQQQ